MSNSLERIYPDLVAPGETTGTLSLQLHLDRYHFAGKHLVPGTVADIACGAGYGSYLLASEYNQGITQITGVDLDEEAIQYARTRYAHPLVQYVCRDAMAWKPEKPWNNVVSLETIEHLPNPDEFIAHICRHLAPGGRFIASVPVTPSMDANPYHLNDFTSASFTRMFTSLGLTEIDHLLQKQPFRPLSLLGKKEKRSEQLRKNLLSYYWKHPGKCWLRLRSTLTDGFCNKYRVAVFEKNWQIS